MTKDQKKASFIKTIIYTTLALIAFAANSVICRLALKDGAIDPGMFTSIRLSSGAAVLIALVFFSKNRRHEKNNTIFGKESCNGFDDCYCNYSAWVYFFWEIKR